MADHVIKATRHIRVSEDLADMLGEVLEIIQLPSAKVLDPYIRPVITDLYEKNRRAIESLRASREAARLAASDDASFAAGIETGGR